ncbi:MAG: hypothetical protein FWE57_04810 [Chitinispirillia bacterium]|nr:hypothetical protein [Chitinispirillia bacterium]
MTSLTRPFGSIIAATLKAKSVISTFAFIVLTGLTLTSCTGEGDWGGEPGTGGDGPGGGLNLSESLQALHANAISGGEYTIELAGSGNIGAQPLSFSGRSNITIRLTGSERERMVSLTDNGSLFTIGSGVTLILDNRIYLRGHGSNNAPLVRVNSGGMLIMKAGAKISGNSRGSNSGGGVVVDKGGSFLMEDGEISGNSVDGWSAAGGGVYVDEGADFLMEGGRISGNSANGNGGGVYAADGRFTMTGGEISNNTASVGGGVYVSNGNFTMEGGRIFGNTANTTSSSSGGGGVYVDRTTFTMNGGEIARNTASSGGGVFVASNARIIKTGGTIHGYTMGDNNRNTATSGISGNNRGHAVFVNSNPGKRRESTAGPGLNLDSNADGAAGGWE